MFAVGPTMPFSIGSQGTRHYQADMARFFEKHLTAAETKVGEHQMSKKLIVGLIVGLLDVTSLVGGDCL